MLGGGVGEEGGEEEGVDGGVWEVSEEDDKEGGLVELVAGRQNTASWYGNHLPWVGLST